MLWFSLLWLLNSASALLISNHVDLIKAGLLNIFPKTNNTERFHIHNLITNNRWMGCILVSSVIFTLCFAFFTFWSLPWQFAPRSTAMLGFFSDQIPAMQRCLRKGNTISPIAALMSRVLMLGFWRFWPTNCRYHPQIGDLTLTWLTHWYPSNWYRSGWMLLWHLYPHLPTSFPALYSSVSTSSSPL